MEKHSLKFHFHDPNSVETTADYILTILIQANIGKMEEAIQTFGRQTDHLNQK
ncbi:MAG: hypothetical protein GXW99_10420 [Clostridiales bacterium]|nr:hypothetical protein [Clostridiales bacterium]